MGNQRIRCSFLLFYLIFPFSLVPFVTYANDRNVRFNFHLQKDGTISRNIYSVNLSVDDKSTGKEIKSILRSLCGFHHHLISATNFGLRIAYKDNTLKQHEKLSEFLKRARGFFSFLPISLDVYIIPIKEKGRVIKYNNDENESSSEGFLISFLIHIVSEINGSNSNLDFQPFTLVIDGNKRGLKLKKYLQATHVPTNAKLNLKNYDCVLRHKGINMKDEETLTNFLKRTNSWRREVVPRFDVIYIPSGYKTITFSIMVGNRSGVFRTQSILKSISMKIKNSSTGEELSNLFEMLLPEMSFDKHKDKVEIGVDNIIMMPCETLLEVLTRCYEVTYQKHCNNMNVIIFREAYSYRQRRYGNGLSNFPLLSDGFGQAIRFKVYSSKDGSNVPQGDPFESFTINIDPLSNCAHIKKLIKNKFPFNRWNLDGNNLGISIRHKEFTMKGKEVFSDFCKRAGVTGPYGRAVFDIVLLPKNNQPVIPSLISENLLRVYLHFHFTDTSNVSDWEQPLVLLLNASDKLHQIQEMIRRNIKMIHTNNRNMGVYHNGLRMSRKESLMQFIERTSDILGNKEIHLDIFFE